MDDIFDIDEQLQEADAICVTCVCVCVCGCVCKRETRDPLSQRDVIGTTKGTTLFI